MLLNQTAEYAFRAMALLASAPAGVAVRATELSEEANIPAHYVSKVMRRLVTHGLVHSQRGHGGGFVLARPAEEIRFIDVLEAAEFQTDPKHCAFGLGRCNPSNPCALHPAWSLLNHCFTDWANRTTLAEVKTGRLPRLDLTLPQEPAPEGPEQEGPEQEGPEQEGPEQEGPEPVG